MDKILKSPQAAAILRATSVGRFEAQAGELIENLGEKLERASVEDAPPPPSSPAAVGSERPRSHRSKGGAAKGGTVFADPVKSPASEGEGIQEILRHGKLGEGGQLKTDSDVRFVGVQHREVPLPSAPQHPRYEWLLGIRRGLGFRHYSTRSGKSASVRITANIRRLLPAEQLQLPSNRYLSSNACRKTMASAASAAGVPLATISQHGLWGVSSTTACKHYIDRTYPVQPYTAWVFDWLQPVSLVAPVIAVGV